MIKKCFFFALSVGIPIVVNAEELIPQQSGDNARVEVAPEHIRVANDVIALTKKINAIGAGEMPESYKENALNALKESAVLVGKEVRKVGCGRVDNIIRTLLTKEERHEISWAIENLQGNEKLSAVTKELLDMMRGRPDLEVPATPAQMAEELVNILLECDEKMNNNTLSARDKKYTIEALITRLHYCFAWIGETGKVRELAQILYEDGRFFCGVECLRALDALGKGGDKELSERIRDFIQSINLAIGMFERFQPDDAQAE